MILQPDFCYPNYINLDVNTSHLITLTPTELWYQDDKPFLYDNSSGNAIYNSYNNVLFTNGAESSTVYITIDFSDEIWWDTIKMLNINFKNFVIEYSNDASIWTTLKTVTDYANSSYHWFAGDDSTPFGTDIAYLTAVSGGYTITPTGARVGVSAYNKSRYVRITITTTQDSFEKYIGELYIGQLMFRVGEGSYFNYGSYTTTVPRGQCFYYKQNFSDRRQKEFTDYEGVQYAYPVKSIYECELSFNRLSTLEEKFLFDLVTSRYNFCFFPTPTTPVDATTSIDDVHYCCTRGEWNKIVFGQSADSVVNIYLMETRDVI